MTDTAQINALLDEATAATADRDAARVVAHYAEDLVEYSLAPPLQQPAAEATDPDTVARWMATFDGPITWEPRDFQITVGGDVAFAHGFVRLAATPAGAPEGFSMWLRQTVGLRKVDGAWEIAHTHESVPFAMDGSFLASTDLEP